MVVAQELTKAGRLKGVSLEVKGGVVGLLGPNGAGEKHPPGPPGGQAPARWGKGKPPFPCS